jgi:hypothetical protein
MQRRLAIAFTAALLGAAALPGAGAEFRILLMDTVETVLTSQGGKRVTLRLRSGQETTGTVVLVTQKVVHLSAVAGREYFDAIIPVEAIEAVLVRTRD